MDTSEWTVRFSARLHAQWPQISRQLRDEVAYELRAREHLRVLEPEEAAAQWLAQTIPCTVLQPDVKR